MKPNGRVAALFLAPYVICFCLFLVVPIVYGLWLSLHDWHMLSKQSEFVGIGNYRSILGDDLFRIALNRTALFVLIVVPFGNLVSFLLAMGLSQNVRGNAIYRVALYLPTLLSVTVVALVWRWVLAPEFGLSNYLLSSAAGKRVNLPWLGSPTWVMPSIAMLSIWWGYGGNMLVYLAGLKSVPSEIVEAASLDGATGYRKYRLIVLPILKPIVVFCLVTSLIASSQVFGQSLLLTQGGPSYGSLSVVLYMYQTGFSQYQLGYASAVGYILFVILMVVSAPLTRNLWKSAA